MMTENNAKISVIVPVYKAEKYLERCVRSIQNQTYSNLEIILVDDGSPDNCPAMCDRFAAEDSRIKVIHKENGGVSSARNAGLDVCGGGYICFVDSDDYLTDDTDFLKNVVTIAEETQVDIVAWLWQYQNTNGELVVRKERTPKDFCGVKSGRDFAKYLYQSSYANGLVVSTWNKLYRRSVICAIAFDGRMCEDDAWNDQVIYRADKIFCMGIFGYVYAQNTDSLTNQNFSEERMAFLQTLKTRARLYSEEDFVKTETQKLFLNIYIEYYYKALAAGFLPYADMETFQAYKRELQRCGQLSLKTRIRYGIFTVSPALYKRIVLRRS